MSNNERTIKKLIDNQKPLSIRCEIMDGNKGYYWGDTKYIPNLIGFKNNDNNPYAEIWIGAHEKSPAKVLINKSEIRLDEFLNYGGAKVLGDKTSKVFKNKLPYLMKVLSAAKPLSIQAHPDKKQAEEGWKREKGKGPNYKDDNHKPELICALTNFWALNGFREEKNIIKDFCNMKIAELDKIINEFKINIKKTKNEIEKKDALKSLYSSIMKMPRETMDNIVKRIIKKSKFKKNIFLLIFPFYPLFKKTREYWVLKSIDASIDAIDVDIKNNNILSDNREGKIKDSLFGIPTIYLLNLVLLKKGEAMYLPAGELHAYLQGSGIEIMANSDNVLRGGLTHKHMDINELLKVLTFKNGPVVKTIPVKKSSVELVYQTEAKEFELSKISLTQNSIFISSPIHSADSIIVIEGEVKISNFNNSYLILKKGETAFLTSNANQYKIKSISKDAKIYKASVPL